MLERFIARRLYRRDDGVRGGTRPAVAIATAGVALGLVVMIVSVAITRGFRDEIRGKVTGFTQHIQVANYGSMLGTEELPVTCSEELLSEISSIDNISHVQSYIEKAGILRTDSAFQGFVLKGVGPEYDFSLFEESLVEGSLPSYPDSSASNQLLLSATLADRLEVSVGDRINVYFMQDRIRVRRLVLSGIYRTNFSDYDGVYGLTDIRILRSLNGWSDEQSAGLEIAVADENSLYDTYLALRGVMDGATERSGEEYIIRTTEQMNAGLFAWLDVLNVNVWVILVLMLGIAGFTMISGLLIIIFERTATIGILKSLGASDISVRKIFLYLAAWIVGRGMIIGDIVGISLCVIQHRFRLIPLNPADYYIDSVPCELGIGWLLLLNAAMFVLSILMLVGPSAVIARISPSKSVRFE